MTAPVARVAIGLSGDPRTPTGPEVGFHLKHAPSGAVLRIEEQFVP
jgi:hypothetical protein